MLAFTGLGLIIFRFSNSVLILYFLIQSVSSFFVLLGYVRGLNFVFISSVFLKLALFPFYFWFLDTVLFFPTVMFFLASTLQKLPIFLFLFVFFPIRIIRHLIWLVFALSLLVRGRFIIFSLNWRFLVASSRIGTNIWFFLSQCVGMHVLLMFFLVYSFSLAVFIYTAELEKSISFLNKKFLSFLCIVNLRGVPPFFIFYPKVLVVWSLLTMGISVWFVVLILLFSVFMLVGYLKFSMIYVVKRFSSLQEFSIVNS